MLRPRFFADNVTNTINNFYYQHNERHLLPQVQKLR